MAEKEESWLRGSRRGTVLGESHIPGKAGRQRELSRGDRLLDILGRTGRKGVVAVVAECFNRELDFGRLAGCQPQPPAAEVWIGFEA